MTQFATPGAGRAYAGSYNLPPPPGRSAMGGNSGNGGSKAQVITVIAAILGMLGATISVIVDDYVKDKRVAQTEMMQAYSDYLDGSLQLNDAFLRPAINALAAEVSAIRQYQKSRGSDSGELSQSYSTATAALESIWNQWDSVQAKLEQVRLRGTPTAILAAGALSTAMGDRWSSAVKVSNSLAGPPKAVKITAALKSFETNGDPKSLSTFNQSREAYQAAIEREREA
jgi:hypothetical protein